MKTMETTCVSNDLCRFKEEEEEEEEEEGEGQIMSLGDSRIKRVYTGSFSYFKHTNS